jgi:uncharacterized protein (DUF1778 family)
MEASSMQPSSTKANSPRDININIRAKRTQRDLIDQAAEMLGKTRSDFMLETACREAEELLLDQRIFHLDAERFKQFQALLDTPPTANPKLRELMSSKGPWED